MKQWHSVSKNNCARINSFIITNFFFSTPSLFFLKIKLDEPRDMYFFFVFLSDCHFLLIAHSFRSLHWLSASIFIPTLIRMRDKPFEMTCLHTAADFCNPLGQSVFLQKPMMLNFTLCHRPELFN